MDNLTQRREMDFTLGLVARAIRKETDLFSALPDPLTFGRTMRFPSGPAILPPGMVAKVPFIEDLVIEPERWDGLS